MIPHQAARAGDAGAREKATILIVDDTPSNITLLADILKPLYRTRAATSGERALRLALSSTPPDLILLDIMMPALDGYEVCRRLKAEPATRHIPVIFVTARDEVEDETKGLECGGVDYLTKPISPPIVLARVKTQLLLHAQERALERMVERLEAQALQLSELNRTLEQRVREEVAEVERLGRLKRFFSPPVVELILSGSADDPLKSHRREIAALFIDLRGFTAFTEASEPEDVMGVLREFHQAMGDLAMAYGGTIERFAGDGIMIFFNDPMEVEHPAAQAVEMAIAMQERFATLAQGWRRRGYELAMGIGIAQGYATIGAIGFEGRRDYGAIGTVTNLAARLCAEAAGGQILVSQRVLGLVADNVRFAPTGELRLKGFHKPTPAFAILGRSEAATRSATPG
jgi:class 3 adenylate cyclase